MRVGGFLISQDKAKELTKITGDDRVSRLRRGSALNKMIKQYRAIMEVISYPEFSTRDDVLYIIATRYADFSLHDFYALGKDLSKLPQFMPGAREERVKTIMDDLNITETTFVTCFLHDHGVHPDAWQYRENPSAAASAAEYVCEKCGSRE
ncbi:hypothetical protein VKT23_017933 [Stygiomarasmius scandens]|uniref:Uncharacterized protein n=1 Tax=Marasmiellus scandens TaxID=2682957 RepID=A0ABR1ISZ5_9AGAR